MADEVTTTTETLPASAYTQRLVDALVTAVENATSPEMMAAQAVMVRRLAMAGDVAPSRLPAPLNITQLGGYLNLLKKEKEDVLRRQVLSSLLGVAGPVDITGLLTAPVLFFLTKANDRPAGNAQATIPVSVSVRSDFSAAFDAALKAVHDAGCTLPLLRANLPLPPTVTPPASSLLGYLGRSLEIMPTTALVAPDADPIALARLTAGGPLEVVARQLDATAPLAATVVQQDWTAWTCDYVTCTEGAAMRAYLSLTAILNGSGWYGAAAANPVSLSQQGSWNVWTNITGLVPGVTTFGEELRLLYSESAIAASSVRDSVGLVWDGVAFS